IARAARVPIAERLPFFAVVARTENFALGRQNKIGSHRKLEVGQTGFKQIDRTTGINREQNAITLQIANQLHASTVQNRFAYMRNEGAVEINAQEADFRTHGSD